ncbi:hypothetical protein CHS0354_040132 [Potamilus streckersoni]|uniref:MHD domain-containing protein n=1 Tax=Potamilus streckersoni TaxID=2493646 RepID=A0AAE0SSX1_9BIVA|nr:hypothetical protein CHS0354_040132 [Potamilus streckersoni]
MIAEILVLSEQMITLIRKVYRGGYEVRSAADHFKEKIRQSKPASLQPHFSEKGVYFYYIRRHGLYFVAVTHQEVSPVLVIESLCRFYHICKDFCGMVNEDSIKANLLLIYELLDELLCFGYVQLASTEKLRPYIQSEPVLVNVDRTPAAELSSRVFGIETRVAPGSAANKPVVQSSLDGEFGKNEVFVDIVERMVATVNADGIVSRMEVNGTIKMKNFIAGNPHIKLAVNEDLLITSDLNSKGYGNNVQLDKCSFHPSVKQGDFHKSRLLSIYPPVGEFSVMTYSVTGDFSLSQPFTLRCFVGNSEGNRDLLLTLRLKSEIPSQCHAVNVKVTVPVPENIRSISQQMNSDTQSAEYRQEARQIIWNIARFPGKTEMTAQFRLINSGPGALNIHEVGPAALEFEISGYLSSGMKIRYLRVYDREGSFVPMKWSLGI